MNLKGAVGMRHRESALRVGIVGSGMAGSSAAYFLRQALGSRAEIVVYERNHTVGGRVREIEIGGKVVAAGASIAHSSNRYFIELAEALGLRTEPALSRAAGVWNGQRFDFRTTGGGPGDLVRLLGRYGLSPLRAKRTVSWFLRRFVQLYDLLEQGRTFAGPRELFEAVGLYELSQVSSADYFRRQGISDRFLREMVDGISRSNYLQGAEMHALVNLVSLAGAAMGGSLLSIREGNSALCRGLLQAAGATVRTHTEVREIASGPRHQVTTAGGETDLFDAVIVATPLEGANIHCSGAGVPARQAPPRPFQVTHVTFVVGELNPAYFGLRTAAELPGVILTEDSAAIPFSAIGAWGKAAGSDQTIYKLFSLAELNDRQLSRFFSRRTETKRLTWNAFPVLRPVAEWPSFVLDERLYYVNAMESAVSTMETELMAGRNAVNLLVSDCLKTKAPTALRMAGGD